MRALVCLLAWTASVAGCATPLAENAPRANERVQFIALRAFDFGADTDGYELWVSKEITPAIAWDELVLSWNAAAPAGTHLVFQARAIYPEGLTPWYHLGTWAEEEGVRKSVKDQKDQFGQVQTDTLVMRQPAPALQIRVRRHPAADGQQPHLTFLGISLLNTTRQGTPGPVDRSAWGRVLDVPQRSQLAYEGGRGWCSPTSVSMVLAWWAKELDRPQLDCDVPVVARGVHDSVWEGTGNWSFNVAFAGRYPELRSYAVRLADLSELERWISRGVPVICSVDAVRLNGRGTEGDVGHLVVVVGFAEQGEVVVNDPFARSGQSGRKTVPRTNFVEAWRHSHNTAYLIYPKDRE